MTFDLDIYDDISADNAEEVLQALNKLPKDDTTLILHIHSNGGEIEPALNLAEVINEFDKTVAITDKCCSAATLPFLACKIRIATEDCVFMIHRTSMDVDGNSEEHRMAALTLDTFDNELVKIYSQFAKKEDFIGYMITEKLIPASVLLELNFATDIM